ncbi:DUF1800 domain-containing protein [Sanyastnella coralliicola]|uniref:DUF1800 domain-containing protein n=1 Tax=Sanyastnella coralliicola TaxID=3069118 RepID=UPI0027BACA5D|nr:DUF1800 domain-containing protein [Longitalea sp. SCSIO 12813]
MKPNVEQQIKHLYHRTSFGWVPTQAKLSSQTLEEHIASIFRSTRKYKPLSTLPDPRPKHGDVKNLKALLMVLRSKKDLVRLNNAWIDKMGDTQSVFREQMTVFWHDHFACSAPFGILMQEQNNMLRTHALGSFRDMLHAIAKDPAMILYLNNQQNRKQAPNENFAREVMELFTLGEGNGYTEDDIKEAARAFTGWHISKRGEFEFNANAHDVGEKTIFGQSGFFGGEDVLDMLLDNPQTAKYITEKVYKYFVNEDADQSIVNGLARRFFKNNYNIESLMMDIFTSSWFYDQRNVGVLVKSPVDLLVGYKRHLKFATAESRVTLKMQQVMGQTLFMPPNVAGWKGGRHWINSSSLLMRMRLPMLLFGSPKDIPSLDKNSDRFLSKQEERQLKKLKVSTNWNAMSEMFSQSKDIVGAVTSHMLIVPTDKVPKAEMRKTVSALAKKDQIKWTVTRTMALPEYQLK